MSRTNITQPSFSSGIISTELFSRIDFNKVNSGLKQCENWVVRPAGGVIYRVGTKYISQTKYATSSVSLIPFIYNREDGLCLEFGDKYIRFYKNGEQIKVNGSPHEITTTYTAAEVKNIKFTQNKNDMYLVHPNHAPALLHRNSDTSWTLRDLSFNPSVVKVANVTIAKGEADKADEIVEFDGWQYAVSVVNKDDQEGLPVYSNIITSDIDLLNQPINVTFPRPSSHGDIKKFNVYRIRGGEFYLCYVVPYSNKENFSFKDISFALDTTKTPLESFNEFTAGNYPSAVGFWNQRLVLANTQSKPSTFWMSKVGYPEDFTKEVVKSADDSISLTFNSGSVDAITDIIPMDDLIVFTEGKIWRVSGTSADNMSAFIESYSGSSGLRPFATKKSILYVDSSQNTVSNFVYSYELNGYSGQNLDILARDLMDGFRVEDVSYRDTPYGVMYAVRSDGVLLGLTYLREENIYAWHMHTTKGGYFKAICSVDKNLNDDVYCVVERDGQNYIEMFGSYINNEQDINASWHLDCASRTISNTINWKNVTTTSSNVTYEAYSLNESKVWYGFESYHRYGSGNKKISWHGDFYYTHNADGSGDLYQADGVVKNKYLMRKVTRPTGNWYLDARSDRNFTEDVPNVMYIREHVAGALVYKKDGSNFENIGYTDNWGANELKYRTYSYKRSSSSDATVSSSSTETTILYTVGQPKAGDNAYVDVTFSVSYPVTSVSGNTMVVNGKTYTKQNTGVASVTSVSGLERFNGKKVYILADTNVYRDRLVSNGVVHLDGPASNILVGLPYEGIIETIPQELKYSSGNSTVGANRKTDDGIITYHRSRGLWYGRDYEHLYEIKAYTQDTYSLNIPLESGRMTLKVADGFNSETTFMVVQKNPFPALIQSITLGSTYNGKN